jgi:hypothetical protein
MSDIKEYIVTLHCKEDLKEFYKDMEILRPTAYNCMPERTVECALRREISRNTHYLMTEEEAAILRHDPRVLSIELLPEELGIYLRPMFIQTESTWNKSSTQTNTHKNWGLLRSVEGTQRSNWGSNGTANQSGTIQVNAEGRNVDVVIVDGMIDPTHPELAVNLDGTGGSRVVQFNWFSLNSVVTGGEAGTYVYTPYTGSSAESNNNHGSHIAGTIAGNTQGWARKANIYNINPYSTDVNNVDGTLLIDYIRAFHAAKTVNPETGRKNPTICNHSWGYGFNPVPITNITSVIFQGTTFSGPFTAAQLNSYGIFTSSVNGTLSALAPARLSSVDADMVDAIADGIIMVGAAGNDFTKIDVVNGTDYNNRFVATFSYFYHRGSTPTAATGCVCVGAVNSLINEAKATFSNCGPRVDIYAPGVNIMSSLNTINSDWGGANDPRNSSYKIGKAQGTSMASPQVCGVLAAVLEIYPNFNQADVRQYLESYAKNNQITDTGGSYTDYTSLQGSINRYLFYFKERPDNGNVFPKLNFKPRPSLGAVYPRFRRG